MLKLIQLQKNKTKALFKTYDVDGGTGAKLPQLERNTTGFNEDLSVDQTSNIALNS